MQHSELACSGPRAKHSYGHACRAAMLGSMSWTSSLVFVSSLLSLFSLGFGDDWLFQDLKAEDLEPETAGWCLEQLPSRCLVDFHVGRFDGSQQHRAAQETLKDAREGIKNLKSQPKLSRISCCTVFCTSSQYVAWLTAEQLRIGGVLGES